MSEMIKEFNKGDLLHIDKDGKAQWGFPDGYPWKEPVEYGPCVEDDTIDHFTYGSTTYYKVSSDTPSAEEMKSCYVYGSDGSIIDDLFPYVDETVFYDRIIASIVVCYKTEINFDSKTVTVPSIGIYMADDTQPYIIKSEKVYHIASDFLPLATPTSAGIVKQAAAVANVTAAPTAEEFNALLKSLRDAGILATS